MLMIKVKKKTKIRIRIKLLVPIESKKVDQELQEAKEPTKGGESPVPQVEEEILLLASTRICKTIRCFKILII